MALLHSMIQMTEEVQQKSQAGIMSGIHSKGRKAGPEQQLCLPEVQGMLWLHADSGLDRWPRHFGRGLFSFLTFGISGMVKRSKAGGRAPFVSLLDEAVSASAWQASVACSWLAWHCSPLLCLVAHQHIVMRT